MTFGSRQTVLGAFATKAMVSSRILALFSTNWLLLKTSRDDKNPTSFKKSNAF
jgi:hypothetical protein